MKASRRSDGSQPATLEAVLESVVKLSKLDETEFSEMVSRGYLSQLFPFHPSAVTEPIADFATDEELEEASPLPLSAKQHAELIQASMPRNARRQTVFESVPDVRAADEFDELVQEFRSLNDTQSSQG